MKKLGFHASDVLILMFGEEVVLKIKVTVINIHNNGNLRRDLSIASIVYSDKLNCFIVKYML
jgi:hypothetical protein